MYEIPSSPPFLAIPPTISNARSPAVHGKANPPPQVLFLIGLTIIIGPQKTLLFFARKQKARGTAAFFGGLTLILLRWTLIGFCIELYGIAVLFGDFLGTIVAFARNLPVVGTYIGFVADKVGLGRRNAELPV